MTRFIILLSILIFLFNCEESTKSKNILPQCNIISPVDSTTVKQEEIIPIIVEASDEDGEIESIDFYVNEELLGTCDSVPHQYRWDTYQSEIGYYQIKAIAKDDDGDMSEDKITLNIIKGNSHPTAIFHISQNVGTVKSKFIFDASKCTDVEDDTSYLEIRWDWENDGIWDTDYLHNKIIKHQFASIGKIIVNMELRDRDNATSTFSDTVQIDEIITGTVTDMDGNVYKTVKIGDQWWMAENLRVTHYQNEDPIFYIDNRWDWAYNNEDAYCCFQHDTNNIFEYGNFYNWYCVNDPREIAPKGWHIPTEEDFMILKGYVGENGGEKLKSTTEWFPGWQTEGIGTDEFDFCGKPVGYMTTGGTFKIFGETAAFWTTSETNPDSSVIFTLFYQSSSLGKHQHNKVGGLSIRCVKDAE